MGGEQVGELLREGDIRTGKRVCACCEQGETAENPSTDPERYHQGRGRLPCAEFCLEVAPCRSVDMRELAAKHPSHFRAGDRHER